MRPIPRTSVRVAITDANQVGEARRAAVAVGASCGLSETENGRLALVVSEAAMNVARHAGSGEIILRALVEPRVGVEMLAIDRGGGIVDLGRAMSDGYSSSGSRGAGLGAIARMSSLFDLLSAPGAGTIVLSQIWGAGSSAANVEVGAICLPLAGEVECGDSWTVADAKENYRLFVVDGLGHGSAAAAAANDATRVFGESVEPSPGLALERVHAALRGGRGAAVAAAFMNPTLGSIEFAGVGNISGMVRSDGGSKSMVSHNGTAGHNARRFSGFNYAWPAQGIVILHSDGVSSHWNLDAFPGLLRRHPSLIAAAIYRDFARGRDDATVVVCRRGSELS